MYVNAEWSYHIVLRCKICVINRNLNHEPDKVRSHCFYYPHHHGNTVIYNQSRNVLKYDPQQWTWSTKASRKLSHRKKIKFYRMGFVTGGGNSGHHNELLWEKLFGIKVFMWNGTVRDREEYIVIGGYSEIRSYSLSDTVKRVIHQNTRTWDY
jgi:hypothetical protein